MTRRRRAIAAIALSVAIALLAGSLGQTGPPSRCQAGG